MTIILICFLLFGCGNKNPDNPVELTAYLVGTEPEHHVEFNDELNKLLLKDFNARLNINYIDWNNWFTEYQLVLQSNETLDIIYTSLWAGYYEYARQGLFTAIDDYLPDNLDGLGWLDREEIRSILSVDGEIYAIPANQQRYELFGILYRKDLDPRKDAAPIDSIDSQEAYMAAVKSAYDIVPLNAGIQDALILTATQLTLNDFSYRHDAGGSFFSRKENGVEKITGISFAEGVEEIFLTFRRWTELGYMPLNSLQKNTSTVDSMIAGESAMSNLMHIHDALEYSNTMLRDHPDWDLGFWELSTPGTTGEYSSPLQDALAVSAHSRYPELAVKIIQAIKTREEYNKLFFKGLPGIHYAADDSSKNNAGGAVEFKTWKMSNWPFRNELKFSYYENVWKEWDLLEEKREMTFKYDTERFVPLDLEGLFDIRQKIIDIQLATLLPLELGLVPDPLDQLGKVRSQMLENGYQEFIDKLNSQLQ